MKVDSRINGGTMATRNELNKLSLGDFLAITDTDDISHVEWIAA